MTGPAADPGHRRRELPGRDEADRLARRPPWWNEAIFWPFWAGCSAALRLWLRLRVEGAPPARGPCVLAANHTSFLDPIVLGACVRRRVAYLMTDVVFRQPGVRWFCEWNRAIPLSPYGGNRDALRAARSVLQQGRVVGIFPEGGLSRDGQLMLGSPGAVSLVLAEDVPIVPVGIVGANVALPPGRTLPRPVRVTVRFGEPIGRVELDALGASDRRSRLVAATRLIMDRIAALTGQTSREAVLAAAPSHRPNPSRPTG